MTHLTPISQPNIYFDFDRLTHQKSPLIGWKSRLIFLELSCSNLVANECLRDNVLHRGIIRNSLHMMRFCTVRRFCISYVIWSTPCMILDGKKEVATEVGGGYRMKTFVTNKWGGEGRKSAQDTSFLRWNKKQITGFVENEGTELLNRQWRLISTFFFPYFFQLDQAKPFSKLFCGNPLNLLEQATFGFCKNNITKSRLRRRIVFLFVQRKLQASPLSLVFALLFLHNLKVPIQCPPQIIQSIDIVWG